MISAQYIICTVPTRIIEVNQYFKFKRHSCVQSFWGGKVIIVIKLSTANIYDDGDDDDMCRRKYNGNHNNMHYMRLYFRAEGVRWNVIDKGARVGCSTRVQRP